MANVGFRLLSPKWLQLIGWAKVLRHFSSNSYVPASVAAAPESAAIKSYKRDDDDGLISVEWKDGVKGKFSLIWLRDNAPAVHTYNLTDANKARTLLMRNLPLKPSPTSVEQRADGLRIEWAEGVEATYSAAWLRARNLGDAEFRSQRAAYYLRDYESWAGVDGPPLSADFGRLMEDDTYLSDSMEQFLRLGFVHVVGLGPGTGQLGKLSRRVGHLHNTHYGTSFSVVPTAAASNLAYTARALGLHTDLPFMSSPPQCVVQSAQGGENTFCDGFRVAEALAKERPEVEAVLAATPIEYIDWGKEGEARHHMAHSWPVFNRDPHGLLRAVIYNNQVRSWFLDAPPAKHGQIFEALHTFDAYCYQPRHLLKLRLNGGELVMFANNRILHGREATGSDRHYEGCYFPFDAFSSKIRVIRENLGTLEHASY